MPVWTTGLWTVIPGREEEFVAAWRELVPVGTALGAEGPALLRDRERPNVFRSVGAWPDPERIERFRAEIAPLIRGMDELLESLEIATLDEVYPRG